MPKVLIVADDLTGALDSAVAFAERGLRTLVVRQWRDGVSVPGPDVDVLAIATGTRELSQAEAMARVAAMVGPLGSWADIVFKKVDSRLKGHVAAEIETISRLSGRNHALIAPAVADFGRVVRQGHLSGEGIATPIEIAALFAGAGFSVDIPDVAREGDFAPLVAAAEWSSSLLVGARGLARALAASLAGPASVTMPQIGAPLLMAIGSRDPITLAQVEALADLAGVEPVEAPNGALPEAVPAVPVVVARMTAGVETASSQAVNARFAQGLAGWVAAGTFATVLASGGETANALLNCMDIYRLEIKGELLPGIPLSQFTYRGRDMSFITKSGGFGAPDALRILAQRAMG